MANVQPVSDNRTMALSAVFNFRDVGGYRADDGRTVRRRRLFRSDSLHRLGAADREAFTALGVRTVIDLRRPHEVTRDGRVRYPELRYHHIHPEHAEWGETAFTDRDRLPRWLADRYLDLAHDGRAGITAALRIIADERAAPVVVHCVAGKDRTGVVCALTLGLLGVADEDIAADYALSAISARRFADWARRIDPDADELPPAYLAAPAEAMLLFLAELRASYSSIERYVTTSGLAAAEIEALRGHLLQ